MSGKLYIVATPIGNLGDITLRAIDTLKSVDIIAAEDTRHSKKLLNHYGIDTRCLSLHDHNEEKKADYLIEKLKNGESIALISDAGTPLVSDPGFRFVRAARAREVEVVPIPGACAAIAALSAAGLPSDRFYFEGFLPSKQQARLTRLKKLRLVEHTLIFYESPRRVVDCLNDMIAAFGGDRQVVLARELTKTFETIYQATLADLLVWVLADKNQQCGEFVLLVEGNQQLIEANFQQAMAVYEVLREELPMKQAVKLAAVISGVKKNKLYEWAIA